MLLGLVAWVSGLCWPNKVKNIMMLISLHQSLQIASYNKAALTYSAICVNQSQTKRDIFMILSLKST